MWAIPQRKNIYYRSTNLCSHCVAQNLPTKNTSQNIFLRNSKSLLLRCEAVFCVLAWMWCLTPTDSRVETIKSSTFWHVLRVNYIFDSIFECARNIYPHNILAYYRQYGTRFSYLIDRFDNCFYLHFMYLVITHHLFWHWHSTTSCTLYSTLQTLKWKYRVYRGKSTKKILCMFHIHMLDVNLGNVEFHHTNWQMGDELMCEERSFVVFE